MTIDERAAHALRAAARDGDDIAGSLPALLAASDEAVLGQWRDVVAEAVVWHHARRQRWAELGDILRARSWRSAFYYALATVARDGCDITPAFAHILHPATTLSEMQGQIAAATACAGDRAERVAEILADEAPELLLEYLHHELLRRDGRDVTPALAHVVPSLASSDLEVVRKATTVCLLAAEARQHLGPTIEPLQRLLHIADVEIRGRAAYTLSFHWQTQGELARADELCRHPDAIVRCEATRASCVLLHGGAPTPGLVTRIAEATLDEDAEVRALASCCLTKAWQREIPLDLVLPDPRTAEARALVALLSSGLCPLCASIPHHVTWHDVSDAPEAFSKLTGAGEHLECPRCRARYRHRYAFTYGVDGDTEATWTLERLASS